MPSDARHLRRVVLAAVVLALVAAPASFAADAPRGADAPAVASQAYARSVTQICAHAPLFGQSHAIGSRAGALAVAADIRATSQRRLALVARLAPPREQRATVARWLAVEWRLAKVYAAGYISIYDLIAAPYSPSGAPATARRLARLVHSPDRLRREAGVLERRLRVPDCIGG